MSTRIGNNAPKIRSLSTPATRSITPNKGVGRRNEAQTGLPQKDTFATGAAAGDRKHPVQVSGGLQQKIQGGGLVARGQQGPSVQELQEHLNQAGAQPPLESDGVFGPRTEAALRAFQQKSGIAVDGLFGPESLQTLQGALGGTLPAIQASKQPEHPPVQAGDLAQRAHFDRAQATQRNAPVGTDFAPEPGRATSGFAATRTEREQQAEQLLRSNGAWPPEEGRTYAIQIDQDAPPGSASRADRNSYVRAYTGETSVFRVVNGRLQETAGQLRSASHPGQYTTSSAPDVTGDGTSDIAHIRPGVYTYNTRTNGSGRYNPTSNRQFSVARDYNHNGVIDGRERDGQHSVTGIQIHVGNSNRPSSIGCQTMPPADYGRFQDAVRASNTGNNRDFTYLLVRRPNDRFGENKF